MTSRPRSRSRSPLRTRGGIFGNDRPDGGGKGFSDRHSDKMVYLSNLPYEMNWMALKDYIRDHAKITEVPFVEILENKDGRSKGCAVVEFKTKDSAIKCVEAIHRTEMGGRLVVAKEIRDPIAFFRRVKDDTGIDFFANRPGGGGGGGGRDRAPRRDGGRGAFSSAMSSDTNTYGLSSTFLDQLNIKPPLCDRVFITNISYACGVGRLYDIASLAGRVTWLDLQLDAEGKSKGMAIVQYSHPIEAVQAISMLHNQKIYDRTISVKMDRFDKEVTRREGELPIGLRSVGTGLGANGAPLADVASVFSMAPSLVSNGGGGGGGFGAPAALNPFVGGVVQPQQPVAPFQQPYPMGVQQSMAPMAPMGGNPLAGAFQAPQQQPQQQPQYGSYGQAQPHQHQQQEQSPVPQQQNTPVYYQQQQPQPVPAPSQQYSAGSQYKQTSGLSGASSGGGYSAAPHQGGFSMKTSSSAGGDSMLGGGSGGGFTLGMGLGGSSYEQIPSRILLIKNLPQDYSGSIVGDRLQQFGDIENVEIISPGVAKVRFIQVSDAERAKSMLQGTTVEGRVIGIEYL